ANQALVTQVQTNRKNFSSGSRAQTPTFYIDYQIVDEAYSDEYGFLFENTLVSINRRYANTSTGNLRWLAQVFYTLIDFNNNSSFPFNSYPVLSSTLYIDSLLILYAHENLTGNNDTIIVSIFDGNTLPVGLSALNTGNGFNNTSAVR